MDRERRFDLVETMAFDPHEGLSELDRHLQRLKASADALDFRFDRHVARNELQAATFRAGPSIVRMCLSRSGALAIELRPMPAPPAEPVHVALADLPVDAHDPRLAHRTTDRGFLDEPRLASGAYEVVFVDRDGYLTSGSFTALFVDRGRLLLTPPPSRARIPSVLREALIEEKQAEARELGRGDLDSGFLIGNSVVGLLRARLAR